MNLFTPNHRGQKRHQILPSRQALNGCGSITSLAWLKTHLQTAIEIEHATIPTYLCALYSIQEGTNTFAYQTIQSVVMEEMLHMLLAANILIAIGGQPAINTPNFIPEYPTPLPHSGNGLIVPLQKFSKDTIEIFLGIEKPAKPCALPQPNQWQTIGQFYEAIEYALRYFDQITPGGIFVGDPTHQIGKEQYYGGGGEIIEVRNLKDALAAINEIIGQGEGMAGSILDSDHRLFGEQIDYAHYYKFNEIKLEKRYCPTDKPDDDPSGPNVEVDWDAVHNMQPNPKMTDYPKGSALYRQTLIFNQTYMALLDTIHEACNGQPTVLSKAIPLMYDLKYKALALMQTPLKNGQTAGPSFEYVASRVTD